MTMLDAYSQRSPMRDHSPKAKILFGAGSLAVCLIWGGWPVCTIVFGVMSMVCILRTGVSAGELTRIYMVPLLFILLGAMTVMVEISRQPGDLFFWPTPIEGWFITASRESFLRAAQMLFRAMAGISCLSFLFVTTPVSQFLAVMERCKVPQLLIELALLTYRFIFVLLGQVVQIATAQKSRLGYRNIPASFRSGGLLGSAAFVKAFIHANATITAMQSRGYDGKVQYLGKLSPCAPRTCWMLAGYLVLLAVVGGVSRWG